MRLVLWGSLINALAILAGALLGVSFKMREEIRVTVMQGLGLAVLVIGIKMGLASENILIPIASMVVGGMLGECIHIEHRLAMVGNWLERIHKAKDGKGLTQGFLTASLVYCVGAMAVLGALDSGLQGSHDILYAKSMLDGVSAIFFASSFGIGVAFSAVAVFLYQGIIALLANSLAPLFHPSAISEMTSTGGMLIIGIGINVLGLAKVSVGNLLPALVIAVVLSIFF